MEMQLAAKFIGAGLSTMGLAGINHHHSAGYKYFSMLGASYILYLHYRSYENIIGVPCSTTQRLHEVPVLFIILFLLLLDN